MSVVKDGDFLQAEHEAFRDSMRRFLAARPRDRSDPRDVVADAGRAGLLGLAIGAEHGGGGEDDLRFGMVLAQEAMTAGRTADGLLLGLHDWVVAPVLARHATVQQQSRWLPGLAAGNRVATVAGAMGADGVVEALPAGGGWELSGSFPGVIGVAAADLLLLVARAGGELRLVVVDTAELAIEPVTGELGAAGAATGDVVLDRVAVPELAMLPGGDAARDELRCGYDLWLALLAVAGARAALSETVGYVLGRTVFGHPVADFENTRWVVAEVAIALAGADALVEGCIRDRAAGRLSPARGTSAALAASAVHSRAVDEGLQLHGGYGYMREFPIAQAYADARRLRLEALQGMSGHDRIAATLGI